MEVRSLEIPEVLEIVPTRFDDDRGFIAETYNAGRFAAHGLDRRWAQDNQSRSEAAPTLRGLHYQAPPFAQDKLVRVLRGRILDVAVDIRPDSPTFGRWVSCEVSAERFNQIFVPAGFAHGFLTLEPQTEVFYKVSAPYAPAHERGIRWDDPVLGIIWGLGETSPILSPKDRMAPLFCDMRPVLAGPAGRSRA